MCLQCPFPVELQWEIALWLKDTPHFHSRYALVSRDFHKWLLPYLYPRARLTDTGMAARFVDFMLKRGQPRNVQELYIGRQVDTIQTAGAISKCRGITTLTIRSQFWPTGRVGRNLILEALENLHDLKSLSIALVTLTGKMEVDLSKFPSFHQLTHLHLIDSAITQEIAPESLSKLPNLTHLSLHWFQSRHCIPHLRQFLARHSSSILVLWVPYLATPESLKRKLADNGLIDRRVVLFMHERYNEYMRKGIGGFWQYAERLVTWRIEKNTDPSATNVWIEIPVWDRLLRGGTQKLPVAK